uniref:Ig-like domain-containing protein n=1 Tax=Gopherus evgoodei TaxID=1825980 RepID=A0A8C4YRD4_9SAUR
LPHCNMRPFLLVLSSATTKNSPHTLHYFYTGVSEPGPRLPQFIAAGYVDGQLIIDYTTKTKNAEPRTEWMARNLDPTYWDQETRIFQVNKARFRDAVETLRNRYNQSKGFHTWQFMAGCELLDGRSTGGYWQYGYDGRDFISLDKETLTWTAADTGAQVTKGKWEADRSLAEYGKWYLEQNCVEELRKYLEYGKETLQRKGEVGRKPPSPTTLSCRAHGFYPRNIAVTWVKDGETRDQETQRGGIVPNEDGTYYTWAATEVDPKETDLYTCRVEHESLRKPLPSSPGTALGRSWEALLSSLYDWNCGCRREQPPFLEGGTAPRRGKGVGSHVKGPPQLAGGSPVPVTLMGFVTQGSSSHSSRLADCWCPPWHAETEQCLCERVLNEHYPPEI